MSTSRGSPTGKSNFLKGIKIVELAGLAPVPFCGLLLADFGATVILVINKSSSSSISFEQRLHRGKQKFILDFKCPQDLAKLFELCQTADVLLDPYRPGTIEQFGLKPEKLMQKNPRLVIARLTGYGQTGPMATMGGHDINYVALSGLMPIICGKFSRKNGDLPLWPPANLLADFAGGGLLAAFAVVSALFRRTWNGGIGCLLDCSMTEGLAYLGTFISMYRDQTWMWDDEYGIFTGKYPMYRTYETADGKWMAVGAVEPKFRHIFLKTLGLEDDGISTLNLSNLANKLSNIFRTKTQSEWTRIFQDKDACVTPVLDMSDKTFGLFEQHRARGSFELGDGKYWIPKPAPIEMFLQKEQPMKAKL